MITSPSVQEQELLADKTKSKKEYIFLHPRAQTAHVGVKAI